jgi:toxin ParE1/3/4
VAEAAKTSRAERDLLQIWLYVAERSEPAADAVIDSIEHICDLLSDSPQMGRSRTELGPGLRSFPAGRYVLYYRLAGDDVVIVRVLSGSREVKAADLNG